MLKRPLKSAVVGLGVGRQHALTLIKNPRTEFCAVVEHDQERAQDFIKETQNDAIKIVNFNDVINNPEIDLLSIASFDDDHFEQVVAGLRAGKHIFVEKPLCQSQKELEIIFDSWSESQKALASNLVLRKAPLYLWLKSLIQSGELGEIYSFDGDYLYGRMNKITSGWRTETKDYSIMQGGGIHIIDLMLWLTGEKPTAVQSCANQIATRNSNFRYNDFHSSHFYFESGMIGRITANFGCIHRHHHTIRIFGTKGTFIYDDAGTRLHRSCDEGQSAEKIIQNPLPKGKGVLISDFIETIFQDAIRKPAQREFDLMAATLASDAALNVKEPVEIKYLEC